MRRWTPVVAAYALSAALLLPAVPLAADEQPAPGSPSAAPTTTAPSVPTEIPTTPASPPPVPGTPPSENASEPAAPDAETPASSAAPASAADRESGKQVLARAAAPGAVTIADFSFRAATVTVGVGDSVTWTNQDDVVHTATGSSGGFDTGDIEPGASGSATFDEAGSFNYICKPHPFMKGTVVVNAAASGGGGDGGTSDGSGSTTGSSDTGGSTAAGSVSDTDDSSGPRLPNTGLDALLLVGLGVLFLGLGMVVNRRAAEPSPRGRAGW